MDPAAKLLELEARISRLEAKRSDVGHAELKILEAARQIARLKAGNFYMFEGQRILANGPRRLEEFRLQLEMAIEALAVSMVD